ncbi:porin [Paraburkholderia hayleyella]|uniref:porin n=1 Tax=Paraburkholderia hayleyella TaxID=2152889 RepID=UPI0012908EFA|nr:porin [Paraburkholderia hayleyella]
MQATSTSSSLSSPSATRTVAAIALACTLSAISGASRAQGSITLYGVLDAGMTYVSNTGGAYVTKFDDGVSYGNRWGIKGRENLGAGLDAVFVLESGFRLGNGQLGFGGAQFGRQAYVGVHGAWGTLSFGNQLDMTNEMVTSYNVSGWASGYAIHQGDFDRFNGDRLPNALKYLSDEMAGLKLGAMFSFGGMAGDFHRYSAYSFGAHYANGPFTLGAAYTQLNQPHGIYAFDPYAMLGTRTFLGQATVNVDPVSGTLTDLYARQPFALERQATFGIGSSYALGNVTLMGNFTYTTLNAFGVASVMKVLEGGANWQITAALSAIGGYQYSRFEGHHWNQVSFGIHYLLSKRTDIYLSSDYLKATQGVNAVIGYSFAPSSTPSQANVRVGMRHSF